MACCLFVCLFRIEDGRRETGWTIRSCTTACNNRIPTRARDRSLKDYQKMSYNCKLLINGQLLEYVNTSSTCSTVRTLKDKTVPPCVSLNPA